MHSRSLKNVWGDWGLGSGIGDWGSGIGEMGLVNFPTGLNFLSSFFSGSYDDPTILERIHCTDQGEEAGIKVRAYLTDGTNVDATGDCTYTSSNSSIIQVKRGDPVRIF